MDRYYTTTRTVRVEPTTGMIVNGTGEIYQFYARDDAEAEEMVTEEGRAKEGEREAQPHRRSTSPASGARRPRRTRWPSRKDSKSALTITGTGGRAVGLPGHHPA